MSNNILDSRDLEKRFDELLEEFEDWRSNLTDEEIHEIAESHWDCEVSEMTDENFLEEWQTSTSEGEEHKQIGELKDQNIYGWNDGVTFVKDSYFEEFAEDEADQLGYFQNYDKNAWPYNCIDWSEAASQLQNDYSSVEFDGETYWYRDCWQEEKRVVE